MYKQVHFSNDYFARAKSLIPMYPIPSLIWQLPLHFRQQDQPCSIYMIELYLPTHWSVSEVQNQLIYDSSKCSWSFHHFRWNVTIRPPLRSSSDNNVIHVLRKGRNGLIYTQFYCILSFRYFWNKWACQQQRQNTMTSALCLSSMYFWKVNGPIKSSNSIWQLPLHFRQQDLP